MPDNKTLAQIVKAQYPVYANMPDADLEAAIEKKYPNSYPTVPRTIAMAKPEAPPPPDAGYVDPRALFGENVVGDAKAIGQGAWNSAKGVAGFLGKLVTPPTSVEQGKAQNADLVNQFRNADSAIGEGLRHSVDWLAHPIQSFQDHPIQTSLDAAQLAPVAGAVAGGVGRMSEGAGRLAYQAGVPGATPAAVRAGLENQVLTRGGAANFATEATATEAAARQQFKAMQARGPNGQWLPGNSTQPVRDAIANHAAADNLAQSIPNQNFNVRPSLNLRTALGLGGYGALGLPGAAAATAMSSPIGLRGAGLALHGVGQGLSSLASSGDEVLRAVALEQALKEQGGQDDWWSPRPQQQQP